MLGETKFGVPIKQNVKQTTVDAESSASSATAQLLGRPTIPALLIPISPLTNVLRVHRVCLVLELVDYLRR